MPREPTLTWEVDRAVIFTYRPVYDIYSPLRAYFFVFCLYKLYARIGTTSISFVRPATFYYSNFCPALGKGEHSETIRYEGDIQPGDCNTW